MGNNHSHLSDLTVDDIVAQQNQHNAHHDPPGRLQRLHVSLATSSAPHAATAAVSMKYGCLPHAANEQPCIKMGGHSTSITDSRSSSTLSEEAVKARGADYHLSGSGHGPSTSRSSSSVVSISSRGFTNDDTIPWHGSPHGSMSNLMTACDDTADVPDIDTKDRCLQCIFTRPVVSAGASDNAAAAAGAVSAVAGPSMPVGQLTTSPKSTKAAEQVVWVLAQDELHQIHASNTKAEAAADAHVRVTSPAFILPCAVDTDRHDGSVPAGEGELHQDKYITIEWRLALQPSPLPCNSKAAGGSSYWNLSLLAAAVIGAAGAADGIKSPWKKSPWQIDCAGKLEVTAGMGKARRSSEFQVSVHHSSEPTLFPFVVSLDNPPFSVTMLGMDTDAKTSSNSLRDRNNQAVVATSQEATVAHVNIADRNDTDLSSNNALHIAVTFSNLQWRRLEHRSGSSSSGASQQRRQVDDCCGCQSTAQLRTPPVNSDSDQSTSIACDAPSSSSSSSALPMPGSRGSIGSTAVASATADNSMLPPGNDTSINARPPTIAPPPAAAAPLDTGVVVKQLEAVLLSNAPRMLVIDDFLDAATCEGLMELARDKLVRSRVASGSETPSRTSWSHFFVKDAAKHPLILSAEAQIEALFACPAVRGPMKPLAKAEALQVVKYHKGEFYHEHYDNKADSALTRAATIIVYLCDTAAGGATSFPRAVMGHWKDAAAAAAAGSDGGGGGGGGPRLQLPPSIAVGPGGVGIKVFPVRGRALVFWSKRVDGNEDPNSIHAADTVQLGEKWIATRWMKDT